MKNRTEKQMRIENEIRLDYDDVLIRPKRSTLKSRSEVDLTRNFIFKLDEPHNWTGVPIAAANMDTTGTFEIAEVLEKQKMITCLHKHYEVEELFNFFFTPREYTAYSMGITDADLKKWNLLKSKLPVGNIRMVCIDVANGYSERFIEFVETFAKENPSLVIIAGNVVTADVTEQLILAGVHIVKVGIGSGAVCTTRLQAGVGMPQLSAVIECADAAHGLGGYVMADGGIVHPGDIAKAFGAGADFVMCGSVFAGHEESGGETTYDANGNMTKTYYGMSSKEAMVKYYDGVAEYKTFEGKSVKIPFKGSIIDTVQNILGGLRSACTYVGATNLKQLPKRTTFIRINNTHNRSLENK